MSDVTSTAPEPEEPGEGEQAEEPTSPSAPFGNNPMIGKYLSGLGFSVRGMYDGTGFLGYSPYRPDRPPVPKPDQDKPTEQMYGMQLIKAMSKEDMIEELMYHFRLQCEDLNKEQLIHNIVHARLQSYSQRLNNEARDAGYGSGSIFR